MLSLNVWWVQVITLQWSGGWVVGVGVCVRGGGGRKSAQLSIIILTFYPFH